MKNQKRHIHFAYVPGSYFINIHFAYVPVVSDEVPLVVSRQLLPTFAQELGKLEPESQEVAHYALTPIQPRVVSFQEQRACLRASRGRWRPLRLDPFRLLLQPARRPAPQNRWATIEVGKNHG